jgi:hypothetical protein
MEFLCASCAQEVECGLCPSGKVWPVFDSTQVACVGRNRAPPEELESRDSKRTRFYHRLTIPCQMKNHTLRIRVDETPEDREIDPSTKRQRFNRTEHLRQIPPDTHAGRRLKGFRQDSESQHSRFDQSYPHKRVPAYGADAALLIYIGYARLSNSVARAKITHALAA